MDASEKYEVIFNYDIFYMDMFAGGKVSGRTQHVL